MGDAAGRDDEPWSGGVLGPFTVRAATAAGASRSRLRRTDLAAPFHGIRARGTHPSVEVLRRGGVDSESDGSGRADDLWAVARRIVTARAILFAPKLPSSAAYSHATAALLLGLALPSRLALDLRIHIATPAHADRTRISGVVAHVTPSHRLHVVTVDGVRCADPVDTWLQLAAVLDVDELVALGDQLVRRQHPMTRIDLIERAIESSAGRHGIVRARAALERIRPGTDSPRETRTRLAIVDAGLPEPEVNAVILDRSGRYLRRGDLVYRRWKVLVEYDGDGHRTDRAQFRLDIDVHEALRDEGWLTVRIHGGHSRADVATLVERALRHQGWR